MLSGLPDIVSNWIETGIYKALGSIYHSQILLKQEGSFLLIFKCIIECICLFNRQY